MTQSITNVSGIGESSRRSLATQGIKTIADLANAKVEQLKAMKGFGEARAASVIASAIALLEAAEAAPASAAKGTSAKKEKAVKKKKDKKSKKKKDKKKKNKKKSGKSKNKKKK